MADLKKMDLDATDDSIENKTGRLTSRRGFLKGTIVAGLAIAGTAVTAKKAAQALLKEDYERFHKADELRAERVWKGKKLVIMSKAEKEEMITALVKSFEKD
jgi:hypothetical protein